MYRKPLFTLLALITMFGLPSMSFAQLKSDLMFCGTSSRTGTNLYDGLGPFTEVSACVPDGNTQALLVTRSGTTTGHGAEWLAYLNAGGVIITEYSISAQVYNEIYGTSYVNPGVRFGDCMDNAMPSLKLNTDHPFWVANSGLTETPSDLEPCGYDLSAIVNGEVEVTALGGLVGTSDIEFAIRPQGDGVLWLVDADWQDDQIQWTNDSSMFMAALISGGTYAAPLVELVPVPTLSMIGLLLLAFGLVFLGMRFRARI